ERRMPLRRWVGSTPTHVTPATGIVVPPGSVRSNAYAPAAPTKRPASTAAMLRSRSPMLRSSSSCSGVGWLPNAVKVTLMKSANSSLTTGRSSSPREGPVYSDPMASARDLAVRRRAGENQLGQRLRLAGRDGRAADEQSIEERTADEVGERVEVDVGAQLAARDTTFEH